MIDSVSNPQDRETPGPEADTVTEPVEPDAAAPSGADGDGAAPSSEAVGASAEGGGAEGSEAASTDAETAEATPADADVVAALLELQEEFDVLNDRHLRLAAEFNNYRRRVEQERLDTWGRAQADLVEGLLDVLDDLQRVAALDLSNATVETIMEGIDLVERKFVRKLADTGAEVLDPETGTPFDPEVMEAMMRVPVDDEAQDETVAQVMQKGYTLKGQLVRPARVSVHKHGI